jgi:hypothetical protein
VDDSPASASLNAAAGMQVCPRCGGANQCALSADAVSAADCWCAELLIDPERLAPYRDQAQCLCHRCSVAGHDTVNFRG